MLFFQGGVGIHFVERVLVQEVFADGAGAFQGDTVLEAQGVHAYQTYDFVQFRFFLEDGHHLGDHAGPVGGYGAVVVVPQAVAVQGVALQPVDGREMTGIGQGCRQAPEYLDDTQRSLGYRFGNIAAGG